MLTLMNAPALRNQQCTFGVRVSVNMHAASGGAFLQLSPGAEPARRELLFDPQTSGGLLVALPPARSAAFCDALRERGYARASVIGEVTAREGLPSSPVQAS
ncbi:MAG: AIR synthase-related protein [Halioglobus sp.]